MATAEDTSYLQASSMVWYMSSAFLSLLAHFWGKKWLLPLNWNPSIKIFGIWHQIHSFPWPLQSSGLYIPLQTLQIYKSSRKCVTFRNNYFSALSIKKSYRKMFQLCYNRERAKGRKLWRQKEILFSPGAAWCRFDGAPRRGSAPKTSHRHSVNMVPQNIC